MFVTKVLPDIYKCQNVFSDGRAVINYVDSIHSIIVSITKYDPVKHCS